MITNHFSLLSILLLLFTSCMPGGNNTKAKVQDPNLSMCYEVNRTGVNHTDEKLLNEIKNIETDSIRKNDFTGMIQIPAGEFLIGGIARSDISELASGGQPRDDEFPNARVHISSFWMDESEVTNAQFASFIAAT